MYWRVSKYLDNKLNILDIILNIIKDISANPIPSAIVVIISIYFFKTLRKMLQELKKIPEASM